MYNISWQVISFPYNANKERIFVAITNRSSQVKFIVVVSSCTSTFGKLKEIWEREVEITSLYSNDILLVGSKRVPVLISHFKDLIRHTKLFPNQYQKETQTFFPALTLNI